MSNQDDQIRLNTANQKTFTNALALVQRVQQNFVASTVSSRSIKTE